MNIDELLSWTAFIGIVIMIYVVPKAYNIKKARARARTKPRAKRTLPKPAPLLGVVYPHKTKTTKKDTK
jgi:hypothetical protein